jgi:hypothetical protein
VLCLCVCVCVFVCPVCERAFVRAVCFVGNQDNSIRSGAK